MKRLGLFIFILIMIFSMTACGNETVVSDSTERQQVYIPDGTDDQQNVDATTENTAPTEYVEEVPNQEVDWEYEQKIDQGLIDPVYGLDLSEYDDHGEWSSDRMWVEYTASSWDGVITYYGYIDTEGNVVGQWHEKGGIYYFDEFELSVFENDPLLVTPWTKPGDFMGNYAVISCGDCTEVIDLQGNTVVRYTYYSVSNCEPKVFGIEDDLMIHIFCPRYDRNNLHMLRITNGTAEDIAITTDDGIYMPPYVRMINDLFAYWDYNSILGGSEYCTFDLDGNILVRGSTTYEVVRVYPATDGSKTAVLIFIGADKNEWCVDVDAQGNWLGDPAKY